jgi:hypothetical protein
VGGALFVLLIGCVNVAGLRSSCARLKELATRWRSRGPRPRRAATDRRA